MIARISTELAQRARALAAADPSHEMCGLLLGRHDVVSEVRACRNVAADRRAAFEIDPAELVAAHRAARVGGAAVLGCWHSHPNGEAMPSPRDAAAAERGQAWLIVTLTEARLFVRDLDGFVELPVGEPPPAPCLAGDPPP